MNKLFDTHNSHSPAGLDLLSQDGLSHALVVRSHTLHHGPHLPREVRSGKVRSGQVRSWGLTLGILMAEVHIEVLVPWKTSLAKTDWMTVTTLVSLSR